jgi:hypothetical protein
MLPMLLKVSPPGWSGTTEAMKRHPEVTNPWALAWWMKRQGYKPHYPAKPRKPRTRKYAALDPAGFIFLEGEV